MEEKINITNREKAINEANKVDKRIIEVLESGQSFRVEAGAGSGKTYSLNKVIEWLQDNKQTDYQRKKQSIVCLTYTNVAVEVISERLADKSFIIPSTIHSFAWSAIKQYQSTLLKIIAENDTLHPKEGDISAVTEIQYELGHRYISNDVMYLHHSDVITLFSIMLDSSKFRSVFANKFPLILIDEYQDSFKTITDKFIEYFISKGVGPQFGFFGDAWQTIYQSNNVCGLIENDNLIEIKKSSNFRSAEKIVDLLNRIRPNLPQISAMDEFQGETIAITCDDYTGARRTDRNFKNDLPAEELRLRLVTLNEYIKSNVIEKDETIKNLMITHRILASQQGYDKLFGLIGDKIKDKDDDILLFFMNILEPVYNALVTSDMALLFETLGIKRYPIQRKSEKKAWTNLKNELTICREKSACDVLKLVIDTSLIPLPPKVANAYKLYQTDFCSEYNGIPIKEIMDLPYKQFIAAIDFLHPETEFSTEHGVKGEEYDNVIFVISKGWNQYQFDIYAPMLLHGNIPLDKQASFERNRNLFYVCCSRPAKRLYILITFPVDRNFETFLKKLVGDKNYYTYKEFLEK